MSLEPFQNPRGTTQVILWKRQTIHSFFRQEECLVRVCVAEVLQSQQSYVCVAGYVLFTGRSNSCVESQVCQIRHTSKTWSTIKAAMYEPNVNTSVAHYWSQQLKPMSNTSNYCSKLPPNMSRKKKSLFVIIKAYKIGVMNQHEPLKNSNCCSLCAFVHHYISVRLRSQRLFIPDVIWAVWEANNRREPEDRSIVGKH